jgi:uncharacterized repeat protein (TIGR03803 family)
MKITLFRETKTTFPRRRIQAAHILSFCALLLVQIPLSVRAEGPQIVPHAVPTAVATATKVRPSMRLEKLDLSIGLPLRNAAALTNLLQQLYDPASPNFHHFLTVEQFTEKFGPTKEDYDAVVKFAHAHGLTVTSQHPNRVVVGVNGTVLAIEKALHVSLNEYQHPTEARTFRAPDKDPTLDLGVSVKSIGGLDNFLIPKPNAKPMPTNSAQLKLGPSGNPIPQTGSGSGGAYEGKDFRAAYAAGVTNTGTGQNVGLLEFDSGFYQSDITAFETAAGEPNVPVNAVLLGWNGGPGTGNSEVSLDIEMAIGMAPGLSGVYVYEGGVTDTILSAMATGPCLQLSASWTYTIDATSDDLWLEMAAQGQSYFNAAGDDDAYVGTTPTPTTDANLTVVGGTELTTTGAAGTWVSEVVWNQGGGEGTGGGISTTTPIPVWQQGISMTLNQGSTVWRNSPDVAACAYDVYVYSGDGSAGAFVGTSCATPTWAAYIALVNQLALANGEAAVGFINPAIYNMGKGLNTVPYSGLFHDITSGNNEWSSSPSLYPAVVGYDLCTGWGTPIGSNMSQALGLPESLKIIPYSPTIFSGPVGGPFTPTPQTYTLTNKGGVSLNWSLSTPPSWLDVSLTSGTLVPGGASETVSLNIDPSATNFVTGDYTTELSFTDLTDGFVQSLLVTLAVVTPPVITSQPAPEALLAGQTANFSVGVATNALVYYQWQENGANLTDGGNISGSATSNLTLSNITPVTSANYSVIVSNAAGFVTSSNAFLTIVSHAPEIEQEPTNTSVLPGATASFSVAAVGTATIVYHWFFNGASLANSAGKYGGVTSTTLYITNVVASNAGNITVTCSNTLGVVTSTVAVLTPVAVTAPGIGLNVNASFTGGTSVENPYSAVVYDSAQSAYFGTSFNGGTDGGGCTYKVTAAGTVSREHSFGGSTDGAFPVGSLCLGKDGSLYGVSYEYGTYLDGSLWKQSATASTLTAEIQFDGDNGTEPVSGLMQASDNNLYGCANAGGAYGYGTVFRFSSVSGASNLTAITSFNGLDGAFPSPVLIQATDGNLYGTSESGGPYSTGAGNVFRISTTGVFQVLYNFTGGADGDAPIAGVIQANDGNFYGTTLNGGAYNDGVVFKMTPAGVETVLYSFTGGNDGAEPWGGLVQATDGNLYGTTQQAGVYGGGTVFQIAPTGSLNTVAQFDSFQGSTPEANLVQGPDGNLYGTAFNGGSAGSGVFFSVVLTNKYALAIDGQPASLSVYAGSNALFTVATTGGPPSSYQWKSNGVILANGGSFSGVNTAALTISSITAASAASYDVVVTGPSNSVTSSSAVLTVLASGPTITSQPVSQTSLVGSLAVFSVTVTGDAPLTYQWQKNGVNLTDGGGISGSSTATLTLTNLTLGNGGSYAVLVGDSVASGVASSAAVLTVLSANAPSVTFSNLHSFTGGTADGTGPSSALIQGIDGNLYGTAATGGANYAGTIFRSTLAGTLTTLYSFPSIASATDGSVPEGGLVQLGTTLYGTLSTAGPNDDGAIFQMANYTTVTYPHTFAGTDGSAPEDSLLLETNGNFYGTASAGGAGSGSIFEMTPSGTFTTIYNFTGSDDGSDPFAGLIQGSDGNLYGTTSAGGAGYGTLFNVSTNGTLTTLAAFDLDNGAVPFGGVIQGTDGGYYGTTSQGGANGDGTVFRWSASSGLTTLYSFAGTDGDFPGAGVIQGSDGNLYGTTEAGGTGGNGTVFLISTNGTLSTLLSFDGFNGSEPLSALVQASNGSYYGTAALGGTGFDPYTGGGNGTIFSITPPTLVSGPFSATNAVACLPYSASLIGVVAPPAGDSFSYSLISGPAWLSVGANGLLSGTPTNSNIGTNRFLIGVTDSSGFLASTNLQIIVIADPPPTFLNNPIAELAWANAGAAYSGSVASNATAPYIADGDILSFAIVSGPSWLTLAPNGTFSGTPADSNGGSNIFGVSVTDLGGSSNTANLVIYVNPHPTFSAAVLYYAPAVAGLVYGGTLASNVTDPSVALGDTLTYSLLSVSDWLRVATNGALSGTPLGDDLGSNLLQVQVADAYGLTATASLAIVVKTNIPPSFLVNPLIAPSATAGQPYSLSIATNAFETNAGDTLTFAIVSGPSWLSITTNGVLSGTPYSINAGTNKFIVSATDLAGFSGTGTVCVFVVAEPIVETISTQGTNLLLGWSGGVAPYQVQATTNLAPTNWLNIGYPTNGTSLIISPTNAASYYRIRGN